MASGPEGLHSPGPQPGPGGGEAHNPVHGADGHPRQVLGSSTGDHRPIEERPWRWGVTASRRTVPADWTRLMCLSGATDPRWVAPDPPPIPAGCSGRPSRRSPRTRSGPAPARPADPRPRRPQGALQLLAGPLSQAWGSPLWPAAGRGRVDDPAVGAVKGR